MQSSRYLILWQLFKFLLYPALVRPGHRIQQPPPHPGSVHQARQAEQEMAELEILQQAERPPSPHRSCGEP